MVPPFIVNVPPEFIVSVVPEGIVSVSESASESPPVIVQVLVPLSHVPAGLRTVVQYELSRV